MPSSRAATACARPPRRATALTSATPSTGSQTCTGPTSSGAVPSAHHARTPSAGQRGEDTHRRHRLQLGEGTPSGHRLERQRDQSPARVPGVGQVGALRPGRAEVVLEPAARPEQRPRARPVAGPRGGRRRAAAGRTGSPVVLEGRLRRRDHDQPEGRPPGLQRAWWCGEAGAVIGGSQGRGTSGRCGAGRLTAGPAGTRT